MDTKIRKFGKEKTELKLYASALWKSGRSISFIARDTNKSRETIYRWLKQMDHKLAHASKRKRSVVDEQTKFRILETYVLMKKPKIPLLKKMLSSLFHIQLSASQLRRLIQRWGMADYHPSAFHDSLIRRQFESLANLKTRRGRVSLTENSDK